MSVGYSSSEVFEGFASGGKTPADMTHIALIIARTVVISVGALLMYIAFFLHEDEEGKLQNRLELLWVRIDDLQSHALSKNTIFLKELLSFSAWDSIPF